MSIVYEIRESSQNDSDRSIFLSHSSTSVFSDRLISELASLGVNIDSDKKIEPGSPDFSREIKNMIQREGTMLVLLETEEISSWMAYELGIAAGLNTEIVLFSYCELTRSNFFLRKYGPIITDIVVLADKLKSGFILANLFENESNRLSKKDFSHRCMADIASCSLSFSIRGITLSEDSKIKFGYILLSTARYEMMVNEEREKGTCHINARELTDSRCPITGYPCGLTADQSSHERLVVILNKIMHKCTYDVTQERLSTIIPYSASMGVTFKMFVDCADPDVARSVVEKVKDAGMENVGFSHSTYGNRVYFLLPTSQQDGLFQVKSPDGFVNNYLCPGALL